MLSKQGLLLGFELLLGLFDVLRNVTLATVHTGKSGLRRGAVKFGGKARLFLRILTDLQGFPLAPQRLGLLLGICFLRL